MSSHEKIGPQGAEKQLSLVRVVGGMQHSLKRIDTLFTSILKLFALIVLVCNIYTYAAPLALC